MFLGIDIGTQSVKALLYDADSRRVVDKAAAPLELIGREDGTREQQADWWLQALRDSVLSLSAELRAGVTAMAVSGQQHGLVPLDDAGNVLAPVKLWCDTATTAQCREITAAFGGEAKLIQDVGNPILAGYTASKILWLKQHRPQAYAALATILLPHDYINFHLTGVLSMEAGDASGTGLFDVQRRQWHEGILAALDSERDIGGLLPSLGTPDAAVGTLRPDIAKALGLPADIPVAPGGGDNMMAALGTGNVCDGQLTASLGTSGTLFTHSNRPVLDKQARIAAFCSSTGGWLPLLCTMNCTVATELTRSVFDMDLQALEDAVQAAPIGADGVITVPFFNGERTPDVPGGKGAVFGLDESNYTRHNLARSAMESAVFGLRFGLDVFAELGLPLDSVRLTGGGTGSATWRQMVADVFDMPVTVQREDEGAAFGAALQALWMHSGGGDETLQQLVREHVVIDESRTCEPSAGAVAAYTEVYDQYRRHVESVKQLYG